MYRISATLIVAGVISAAVASLSATVATAATAD